MSARIRSLVTAESKLRAARTIFPLFREEQGSSANSRAARLIAAPEIQLCEMRPLLQKSSPKAHYSCRFKNSYQFCELPQRQTAFQT